MRRSIFIFAVLIISALAKHHFEFKNGFMSKFHKMRKFDPEKFQKWHEFLKNQKRERDLIPHSYEEIARTVNKLKTTWTATTYKRDYTPLLGAILDGGESLPEKTFKNKNLNLPESFDPREEYPNCESIKEIRDQANCGSCWAFGAVEAMSDRICIKSGQKDQTRVSAQNLLACCSSCGFGCDGGYPQYAWRYWKSSGICTGGLYQDTGYCQPYFLPPCDHHVDGSHGACPDTVDTPDCVQNCDDGNKKEYSTQMTYGSSAYSVSGENNIMQELYENGPVEASFTVYEDFVKISKQNSNFYVGTAVPAYVFSMATLVSFGLVLKHADKAKEKEEEEV
jgi:cathepsin B